MSRFKDARMNYAYEYQLVNPPVTVNHRGEALRKTGASIFYWFWRGYDGAKCKPGRNTVVYACYVAGAELRKTTDRYVGMKSTHP